MKVYVLLRYQTCLINVARNIVEEQEKNETLLSNNVNNAVNNGADSAA